MQSIATEAAYDLRAALGSLKRGALRVFGDWFGRPMDNIHWATDASAVGSTLRITFNDDEELDVVEPGAWVFTPEVFRIHSAVEVCWRWYSYGEPKTPDNLYTIRHWAEGGSVKAESDVDWYTPTFSPSREHPAAELL